MGIININCKHFETASHKDVSYGKCLHPKQEKWLWIFKTKCLLMYDYQAVCDLQEKYPRPKGLPPVPPPCKEFKECLFGGLVETKESKQRTNNWRNGFE